MEKQIHLTVEEVISVLKDQENVHTFINAGLGLIGADWSKEELIEKVQHYSHEFLLVIIVVFVGFVGYMIYKNKKKAK